MAAYLLVLYNEPVDPNSFEPYYSGTHLPLAKKIPGLRSLEISGQGVNSPDGSQPFYRIATLRFDSMQALQDGLSSEDGQVAAADLSNFASGGVTLAMYETTQV